MSDKERGLLARIAELERQLAEANRDVLQIVTWMAADYPAIPEWRPLSDLSGMLSQIDNMVSGKSAQLSDLRQKLETAREALEELSRLGNGEQPGNSIGNGIAQRALGAITLDYCETDDIAESLNAEPAKHPDTERMTECVEYELTYETNIDGRGRPSEWHKVTHPWGDHIGAARKMLGLDSPLWPYKTSANFRNVVLRKRTWKTTSQSEWQVVDPAAIDAARATPEVEK